MLETFLRDLGSDEGKTHITHSFFKNKKRTVSVSLFVWVYLLWPCHHCRSQSCVWVRGVNKAFLIKVKDGSAHCHGLLGKPCDGQIRTQNAGRCEWALLQEGDIRPKAIAARNRTKKDSKLWKLIKQNWSLNLQEDTVGETQGRNTARRNSDRPGTSTNSHRRKRGNSRQEGDTAERK